MIGWSRSAASAAERDSCSRSASPSRSATRARARRAVQHRVDQRAPRPRAARFQPALPPGPRRADLRQPDLVAETRLEHHAARPGRRSGRPPAALRPVQIWPSNSSSSPPFSRSPRRSRTVALEALRGAPWRIALSRSTSSGSCGRNGSSSDFLLPAVCSRRSMPSRSSAPAKPKLAWITPMLPTIELGSAKISSAASASQ